MAVTVQNVINQLSKTAEPIEDTVDRLEFGKAEIEVTGIVTAFMATHRIIQTTIESGANLLLTHEGTFYRHKGSISMLESDPVYQQKKQLVEQSRLAIYRLHDTIHRYSPDGITRALVRILDWEEAVDEHLTTSTVVDLPPIQLKDLAAHLKEKLRLPFVRFMGDTSMRCRRAGIFVGYRGGGDSVIPVMQAKDLDLAIIGEGPEWETPEYIRDAICQGKNKALIVIGHAESEKPGMELLAGNLQACFPTVPVQFIDEEALFRMV
ncbi:Nif3-like dinuclear metal center hexameric protein [Sediminibacillus halophilus]|uniref:GTP cyclohydrolase 1 type 2 homolog n=1 Tax=Sediminibacillus halophilus TaxID=482461 RepID=A0A1G9W7Q6_9BACI|nr:Nif3-like dinuclear metal center hexameric protein [Sediminibacillus halophilus]SDM80509.1 Putative GTP cyclohydrolase 1 type 2, NIF3 family [Sediminibacillus halophilus]